MQSLEGAARLWCNLYMIKLMAEFNEIKYKVTQDIKGAWSHTEHPAAPLMILKSLA